MLWGATRQNVGRSAAWAVGRVCGFRNTDREIRRLAREHINPIPPRLTFSQSTSCSSRCQKRHTCQRMTLYKKPRPGISMVSSVSVSTLDLAQHVRMRAWETSLFATKIHTKRSMCWRKGTLYLIKVSALKAMTRRKASKSSWCSKPPGTWQMTVPQGSWNVTLVWLLWAALCLPRLVWENEAQTAHALHFLNSFDVQVFAQRVLETS